jgi:hypothetical protein
MPLHPMMFDGEPDRSGPRFIERKMGKCLEMNSISGVQPIDNSRLLLFLRDRRMVTGGWKRAARAANSIPDLSFRAIPTPGFAPVATACNRAAAWAARSAAFARLCNWTTDRCHIGKLTAHFLDFYAALGLGRRQPAPLGANLHSARCASLF